MVFKGECSRGQACIVKPDPAHRGEAHGKYTKNPFFISSPKDHRYRWQMNGTPNKSPCFKFEHVSVTRKRPASNGILLGASTAREAHATKGAHVPLSIPERKRTSTTNRTDKRWAEQLAEEARVKAQKLHKEIYKSPEAYEEAQLKFFRRRRHRNPEKCSISRTESSVGDQENVIYCGAALHMMGRSSLTSKRIKDSH